MATGYIDANGIWQYGEDDPASPTSDLLNLLAASTSDQVGDLAAEIFAMTVGGTDFSKDTGTYDGASGASLVVAAASVTLAPGDYLIKCGVTVRNFVTDDSAACSVWNRTLAAEVSNTRGGAGLTVNSAVPIPLESAWTALTIASTTLLCPAVTPNGSSALRVFSTAGAPSAWITAQCLRRF